MNKVDKAELETNLKEMTTKFIKILFFMVAVLAVHDFITLPVEQALNSAELYLGLALAGTVTVKFLTKHVLNLNGLKIIK